MKKLIDLVFQIVFTLFLFVLFYSCRSKTTNIQQTESNDKKVIKNDSGNIISQQNIEFNPTQLSKTFKKYKGSMFDIKYPDNFTPRSSKESDCAAYFLSPDSLVEFYVFSPWGITENHEIDFNTNLEIEINNEVKKKDENSQISYYTFQAKDNSYFRSYQDKMEYGFRTIIGLKYKTKVAYEYYKDSYLKFKNSLVQYADH